MIQLCACGRRDVFAERKIRRRREREMHNREANSTVSRSNCQMFATLRADFSSVTIAPYENPN
jgi:hypothetical protein